MVDNVEAVFRAIVVIGILGEGWRLITAMRRLEEAVADLGLVLNRLLRGYIHANCRLADCNGVESLVRVVASGIGDGVLVAVRGLTNVIRRLLGDVADLVLDVICIVELQRGLNGVLAAHPVMFGDTQVEVGALFHDLPRLFHGAVLGVVASRLCLHLAGELASAEAAVAVHR